ncbi:hypothetical protein [Halalkalibacter sp. APA_J-10(15)]|uniref:hypothetical protein n=2 Tax=unclassified Halalkalibacter TaxID=2893063 RepID=UPI001FF6A492|nr:hypothetical protein [Halalkalibacter sp. APA_J-10(15)]
MYKKEPKTNMYEDIPEDRYTAARLDHHLIDEIKALETRLNKEANKEVRLIAYEESQHNPS